MGPVGRDGSAAAAAAVCPLVVAHPTMRHRWELLTFLHWSYPVDAVQRLVPSGLEVESADGRAWVGLVPFFMRVSPPAGPSVRWVSTFCETNVRTYVRDRQGRSGVWFFSLDAARLSAVSVARGRFRLPYYWSRMRLTRTGDEIAYDCVRRRPGDDHPHSRVRVAIGTEYRPDELTGFDHFLTARWRLFSVAGGRRTVADAEHAPWPLHRATVLHLDDQLVAAAGLPAPTGDPLVHYSPGVDVRIGPSRPL